MRAILALAGLCLLCSACDDADPAEVDGGPPPPWGAAFDAADRGAFLSVWGAGPQDVYVVGGQPEAGAAWRFDGSTWAPVTVPDGPALHWVHGADGVLWMVGDDGRALRRVGAGAFEEVPTGVTQALWGVWVRGADEAWAVGGDVVGNDTADPVLIRWDGQRWTRVELPPVDRAYKALFKIWGDGAALHAVGASGVALHRAGGAWRQVATGTTEDLISLWGAGGTLVAVGGRRNGVAARWTGDHWDAQVLAGVPPLNGVWVDAAGTATMVGQRGAVRTLGADVAEPVREESGTTLVLHGVWGTGGGHRVACGGSLLESPPWEGVVVEVGR